MTLKEIAATALDEFCTTTEDASVFNGLKSAFGPVHPRQYRPSEHRHQSLVEHDKIHHPGGFKDGDTCVLRDRSNVESEPDSILATAPVTKPLSSRITIDICDLTKEPVDAIVNAANRWMLGGAGVDGAIHKAAGPQLVAECATYPADENGFRVQTGDAKITNGYNLPAKHVIHTAGPDCRSPEMSDPVVRDAALVSSYRRSLEVAYDNGCKSVAFPSISTGIFGFPLDRAAEIAANEISTFLAEHPDMSVKMCIYDPHDSETIRKTYEQAFASVTVSDGPTAVPVLDAAPAPSAQSTDLQRHDLIYHGGHYDGKSKCKYREAMSRGDTSDACLAAEQDESKSAPRLHPSVRPPEPPPFKGLGDGDIVFVEAVGKDLAFLAQRVNHNIGKGKPGGGSMAAQNFGLIDSDRLDDLEEKDSTGQVKVINDLYKAAKASEAAGWAKKIEVPGIPYDETKYDSQNPNASTGFDKWGLDAKKCPKDPHAKARKAYAEWVSPETERKDVVDGALLILSDKNATQDERDAANRINELNAVLVDLEENVGLLDQAISSCTDAATKKELESALEDIERAYAANKAAFDVANKPITAYLGRQMIMSTSDDCASIAAKLAAAGRYVPPLLRTADAKLKTLKTDAVKHWQSRYSSIQGGQQAAEENWRNNIRALWESDEVEVLINTEMPGVLGILQDRKEGTRSGVYEKRFLDTDYYNLGLYNFDAHYANARECHKYGAFFPKGSTGEQCYGEMELVFNRKKIAGFLSGPHSRTRGTGKNGHTAVLPQNANLTSYWDDQLITQDMSKNSNAGRMILNSFGSPPEFWFAGDVTSDLLEAIRFKSMSEVNQVLADPVAVKNLRKNKIRLELENGQVINY